ncbi:peptidase S8/S53 domain-containing protein [Catenaria anguillulae PL171]|uniref:Peptidase S8/S53 domain-containing protein n=1 Tax=Catenaria anguillulae PL171 TaxID=765915 RepID=A0A1Y2HQ85_9FUNG|nr:peptidase S8/S53 domain-containing protein [Catenaria anguillulae PL171]
MTPAPMLWLLAYLTILLLYSCQPALGSPIPAPNPAIPRPAAHAQARRVVVPRRSRQPIRFPPQLTTPIPNSFIVTTRPSANLSAIIDRHIPARSASSSSATHKVHHRFSIGHAGFRGFAATFPPSTLTQLRADPAVLAIEPDVIVNASSTQLNPPSWGLARISQRGARNPNANVFAYPKSEGKNVDVYVLDTGILASHPEFLDKGKSRVESGWKADPSWPDTDDNGHGTHVAALIAGSTFGVAKSATLIPVKVLSRTGAGTLSTILAGINYVTDRARHKGRTVVANLSFGGILSQAQHAAISAAIAEGVVAVAAAGNDAGDACETSPAAAPGVITVGSATLDDELDLFSNYGTCVDLIAPGTGILSAWNDGQSRVMDGTSFAAPHVSGAAALLLSLRPPMSPAEVSRTLVSRATLNVIQGDLAGTPNRLLYVDESRQV